MVLPQDLGEMTDGQREDVIGFYVGLSLAELRRRQRIGERLTERAWQGKNYRALRSARIDADLLATAIDRREFKGEKR